MTELAYILERIIFGTVCLITFVLSMIKYATSTNNSTFVTRKLKFSILFVNIMIGTICIDPYKQNIFSPTLIRILIRVSTMSLLGIITSLFDNYFKIYCEKIYNASFIEENRQNTSVANQLPQNFRKCSNLFINKPQNISDNQIWYDILIYSNWHFSIGICCLITSFFYWHTFLFHVGICFILAINAIQLHYKWVPYRIAYVHRIPVNFEEYKFVRTIKHTGIWIFLFIVWLLSITIVHNAILFDVESFENINDCKDLVCVIGSVSLDYICFISSIFGLIVLLKFLVSEPIISQSANQPHKEESKNNNSPRPASDITSSVENLSLNDKTLIAKFLALTTDQTENVFIPLNQFGTEPIGKLEQTDEGKT